MLVLCYGIIQDIVGLEYMFVVGNHSIKLHNWRIKKFLAYTTHFKKLKLRICLSEDYYFDISLLVYEHVSNKWILYLIFY